MNYPTLADIRLNPRLLADVSADAQYEELCLAAVTSEPWALHYVEPEFKTPELCLTAVKKDGALLRLVENQTPEICLAAVKQEAHALKYVQQQTPAICLAAVRKDAYAIKHVIDQTVEVCVEVVAGDGFHLLNIKLPTDRLLDPASRQLQHWREVLGVWRPGVVSLDFNEALRPLVDAVPLGKQYTDEWKQPAGDGRLMLELLSDVAAELKRIQPNSDLFEHFCHRVGKQVEIVLRGSPQPVMGDPDPSRESVL